MKRFLESPEIIRAELAETEREIAARKKLLSARAAFTTGLRGIVEAAKTGGEDAIKELVEAAIAATGFLASVGARHSAIIRKIARKELQWPVVTDGKAGWERIAAKHVSALELGADLEFFRARFRPTRGADENYPARRWAKQAVRTIEETRFRFRMLGAYIDELGLLTKQKRFDISEIPAWAHETCKLPQFNEAFVTQWAGIVRKMIREQMPEFQEHADWAKQRTTASLTGRDSRGEIQNAILDDITSALKRLAPVRNLPNEAC